jgi:hypothetical protein
MTVNYYNLFKKTDLSFRMCLVRLKAEGKDGQFMYRKLVEIMWQDVEARMKKMGVRQSSLYTCTYVNLCILNWKCLISFFSFIVFLKIIIGM